MADRPILFSGPMVRALLAGTKTQTRRTMNPQPELQMNGFYHVRNKHGGLVNVAEEDVGSAAVEYLRIAVGDRLYVREHWRVDCMFDAVAPRDLPSDLNNRPGIQFVANEPSTGRGVLEPGRFRQGMHMPRWASRLTLTVTDVRVERLQDCSADDSQAEGIPIGGPDVAVYRQHASTNPEAKRRWDKYRINQYRQVWESINGDGSWESNPWVAAYTFTVHRGNIDAPA